MMAIMINETNKQYVVKRLSFLEKFSLKQGRDKFGQKYTTHQMVKCYISIKEHVLDQSKSHILIQEVEKEHYNR